MRRVFAAFGKRRDGALRRVRARHRLARPGRHGDDAASTAAAATSCEFLRRTGLETGGTYKSRLHTVFADDEWAVAIYRASGSRNGIDLDVEQALVIRMADGLWQEVTAVPLDSAFERFWS